MNDKLKRHFLKKIKEPHFKVSDFRKTLTNLEDIPRRNAMIRAYAYEIFFLPMKARGAFN